MNVRLILMYARIAYIIIPKTCIWQYILKIMQKHYDKVKINLLLIPFIMP